MPSIRFISLLKCKTRIVYLHALQKVVPYHCVKFDKNPFRSFEEDALTNLHEQTTDVVKQQKNFSFGGIKLLYNMLCGQNNIVE